jgi:hypothetical protein
MPIALPEEHADSLPPSLHVRLAELTGWGAAGQRRFSGGCGDGRIAVIFKIDSNPRAVCLCVNLRTNRSSGALISTIYATKSIKREEDRKFRGANRAFNNN